jgi:protein TonB
MQNPALSFHTPLSQSAPAWRRYAGISLAVLLNGGLIWALASGLAVKITQHFTPPIHVAVINTHQPQQPATPPPTPQIMKTLPTETTPVPVIQIAPDSDAQTITVQPQQPQAQPTDSSASGLTNTHTTPPYPPVARRLGQDGTVILSITVGTDGVVTAAQVAKSSGVPELDQAAVDWVKGHWRYKPAVQNGVAVPSNTQAAVKFDLRKA